MKKKYFNELLVIIAAILWGIISLFSKPLQSRGFTAVQIVFIRALLSVVILGVFILIKDKKLFKIKWKDLPLFIGSGVCAFVFCAVCYMASIGENGAGVAVMLMYTAPIWILIISRILFKEKITLIKVVALAGVMIGCVATSLGGGVKMTPIGALLGIGSGIGFALISIFSKAANNKGYEPLTTQFYTFLFAFIVLLPFAKMQRLSSLIVKDYASLLYCFLIALISTVLPFVIYSTALKGMPASVAGMIDSLEVPIGALTGWIAFQENIGLWGVLGIFVMLVALVLLEVNPTKEKKKEPARIEKNGAGTVEVQTT